MIKKTCQSSIILNNSDIENFLRSVKLNRGERDKNFKLPVVVTALEKNLISQNLTMSLITAVKF